eukprot:CAMPEP_0206383778 /NCGR_PEP_ID=MMETSP0294-20121207/14175_1 /ASSEMBLY_ACC=CAM_ASM_000327 /TAXON_ID=39354 /ORGANISM="Heterosigma akashiwo, Strain CCMP2393" /LENGTH=347 /DNA_ID=CAMNT_0053833949 /DNA_START=129 /DNA_END=1172 /DNA_ORIENTATION=-
MNEAQAKNSGEGNKEKKFLQPKFQIGSRKGPINYGHNETVFHPDDIPAEKKENRKQIIESKKPKTLKLAKPEWETSVYIQKKIWEDKRTRANFEHDRADLHQYNFRAERLPDETPAPPPKTNRFQVHAVPPGEVERRLARRGEAPVFAGVARRTQEMDVHPALADKAGWNQSVVLTVKEKKALFDARAERCTQNSQRKKNQISKTGKYVSPEQQYKMRREQDRTLKAAGVTALGGPLPPPPGGPAAAAAALGRGAPSSAPGSSSYRPGASVLSADTAAAPSLATYNRLAKHPTEKIRKFAHSGAWEFNQTEQKWMWSDTGSYEKDSPGDIVTVINPNAYNYASPTMH